MYGAQRPQNREFVDFGTFDICLCKRHSKPKSESKSELKRKPCDPIPREPRHSHTFPAREPVLYELFAALRPQPRLLRPFKASVHCVHDHPNHLPLQTIRIQTDSHKPQPRTVQAVLCSLLSRVLLHTLCGHRTLSAMSIYGLSSSK